jgi:3-phosphoshikimate 1-carboxyvinyltransferase
MGAKLDPDPEGWRIQGSLLQGGAVSVDARLSSQFASALQLISPCCGEPVQLELAQVTSAPYLAMTQALTKLAAASWPPEADWSAAAVFLAGVGLSGIPVRLEGLSLPSLQGDSRSALWGAELGFSVLRHDDGSLEVRPAPWTREAWNPDFSDTPDLAMPAVLAAALGGRPGRASGLHTLNSKESLRLDATAEFLTVIGCSVRYGADWLEWTPGPVPQGCLELDSHQDHRMAFCAALVSLRRPVQLKGSEAVAKSFPGFWSQFREAFGAEPLAGPIAH